ncbi:hypothetical protein OM076_40730 [Solirubrobacter ginsenosidimutans]|uniref:Uncharacterized protein n=1 Tax=Solirubrobacter ginsenosidimutans TaxID=490573 RepID=A0A9X3N887_9ACTN|nr:hypothetical protein [Solirubrobacter ginsenosidimutans]MDA0166658.1 hypothetical protein [Solirubrobacter ginsenosidimutans]
MRETLTGPVATGGNPSSGASLTGGGGSKGERGVGSTGADVRAMLELGVEGVALVSEGGAAAASEVGVRAMLGLDGGVVSAAGAGVRATLGGSAVGAGVRATLVLDGASAVGSGVRAMLALDEDGGASAAGAGVRATLALDPEDGATLGVDDEGSAAGDDDGVSAAGAGVRAMLGLDEAGGSAAGAGVRAMDVRDEVGAALEVVDDAATSAGASAGVRATDGVLVPDTDGGRADSRRAAGGSGDGTDGSAGVRATDAGTSPGGRADRRRGVDGSSGAGSAVGSSVREIPSSSEEIGMPVPAPSTMRAPRERSSPPRAMKRASFCSFDGSGIFSACAIETRSEPAELGLPNIHSAAKSLMSGGAQSGRWKPPASAGAGAATVCGAGAEDAEGGAGGAGGAGERESRVAASSSFGRRESATSRASARPP